MLTTYDARHRAAMLTVDQLTAQFGNAPIQLADSYRVGNCIDGTNQFKANYFPEREQGTVAEVLGVDYRPADAWMYGYALSAARHAAAREMLRLDALGTLPPLPTPATEPLPAPLQRPANHIQRLASKHCGTARYGDVLLFISYRTIIGYQERGQTPRWTSRYYSSTTSRHRREMQWAYPFGEADYDFSTNVERLGFNPGRDRAPHEF